MSTYAPHTDTVNLADPVVKIRQPKSEDVVAIERLSLGTIIGEGVTRSGKHVYVQPDGVAVRADSLMLAGDRPCKTSDAFALPAIGENAAIDRVGYILGGGKAYISGGTDILTGRPCRMATFG